MYFFNQFFIFINLLNVEIKKLFWIINQKKKIKKVLLLIIHLVHIKKLYLIN